MRIGTIGAGMIGRSVAKVAIKHGHEVMISNSRGPDTLFTLRGVLGCKAGTAQEAAEFGDIVLVAIPLKAYRTVPVQPLAGKIVLDANNYYYERDGHIEALDRNEVTSSELLAAQLPKSKVVKVFNTIQASEIESDGRPAGTQNRRALPVAADDAAAKKVVIELLDQFGFDAVDAGLLREGRRFDKGTPAYGVALDREKLRGALAAA